MNTHFFHFRVRESSASAILEYFLLDCLVFNVRGGPESDIVTVHVDIRLSYIGSGYKSMSDNRGVVKHS